MFEKDLYQNCEEFATHIITILCFIVYPNWVFNNH